MPKRKSPENALQRAVAKLFWKHLEKSVLWSSHETSAGGNTGRQWDYIKRGVLPGYPDMSLIWRDEFGILNVLFIELKSQDGEFREAQGFFELRCDAICIPYTSARSIEAVKDILVKYRVPHTEFIL